MPHFGRLRIETTVEAIIIKRPDIVKSLSEVKITFVDSARFCVDLVKPD